MIISHKYKFIFIKTAKTAGTSIEVFLSKQCSPTDIVTPIAPPVEGHQPRNYQGFINPIPEILERPHKVLSALRHICSHPCVAGLDNVRPDNLAWFVEIASGHRGKTGRSMKSYVVKFSDREEGPYAETQMAQMFADGRIDRNTPCKPASGGDWKSVDDYLPMLKYGTQLPLPTKVPAVPPTPPPVLLSSQRVSVVDFDIPFGSVLKIMFKWMAAGFVVFCCFLPVIFVLWLIVAAIFAALFSGAMSTFHHP